MNLHNDNVQKIRARQKGKEASLKSHDENLRNKAEKVEFFIIRPTREFINGHFGT